MKTLITLGLGALAMYLLDPEQGPKRRAMLRDKAKDLGNRAQSGEGETQRALRDRTPESAQQLGR